MPWFKRSVLHINLWAHIKKMIYCTSLHFLRHEQWRTDGTGAEKQHVFTDKAGTSVHTKHAPQVPAGSRSSGDEGTALPGNRTKRVVHVTPLSTLRIGLKHQWQFVFLYKLVRLWILHSAPLILLSKEGMDAFLFFKEHGCSKTERIPKWLGASSNALLKAHHNDE